MNGSIFTECKSCLCLPGEYLISPYTPPLSEFLVCVRPMHRIDRPCRILAGNSPSFLFLPHPIPLILLLLCQNHIKYYEFTVCESKKFVFDGDFSKVCHLECHIVAAEEAKCYLCKVVHNLLFGRAW